MYYTWKRLCLHLHLELLDIPLDVLSLIANHAILNSQDHASFARTNRLGRTLVTFQHIRRRNRNDVSPYDEHGTQEVAHLQRALRCAVKRNGDGCVSLDWGPSLDARDLVAVARAKPAATRRLEHVLRVRVIQPSVCSGFAELLQALPSLRLVEATGAVYASCPLVGDSRMTFWGVCVAYPHEIQRLASGVRQKKIIINLCGALAQLGQNADVVVDLLLAACRRGVRCDELVISGCHADYFKGPNGGNDVLDALCALVDTGRLVVDSQCPPVLCAAMIRTMMRSRSRSQSLNPTPLRMLTLTVDADGALHDFEAALGPGLRLKRLVLALGRIDVNEHEANALRRLVGRADYLLLEHFDLARFSHTFDDATALVSLDAALMFQEDVQTLLPRLPALKQLRPPNSQAWLHLQ